MRPEAGDRNDQCGLSHRDHTQLTQTATLKETRPELSVPTGWEGGGVHIEAANGEGSAGW